MQFLNELGLTSAFTLGRISVEDDDDERRLLRFMRRFPDMCASELNLTADQRQQMSDALHRLETSHPGIFEEPGTPSTAERQTVLDTVGPFVCASLPVTLPYRFGINVAAVESVGRFVDSVRASGLAPLSDGVAGASACADPPPPPGMSPHDRVHLSVMIEDHLAQIKGGVDERTLQERAGLFAALKNHLADHCAMEDPFVDEIRTTHLSGFCDQQEKRPARGAAGEAGAAGGDVEADTISARTMVKKCGALSALFDYAAGERGATPTSPMAGLKKRLAKLRKTAAQTAESYQPFSSAHLRSIFEPTAYLSFNRTADYFWAPLLGAYMCMRLGEIVTASIDDIKQNEATSIWCFTLREENAKNKNSVRDVPIPQSLIDLGFIVYVEHVRSLGAKHLFPHIRRDTRTVDRQPSKNQSRHFGRFLDSLNIKHPLLVFHSFRHTVITPLADLGCPLTIAMQIAGHEAVDEAIRRGQITQKQADSVHLSDYIHNDVVRHGAENPLEMAKSWLEKCPPLPIDFLRMKAAAQIVLDHCRKTSTGFTSGWAPQNHAYTASQLARLA